MNHDAIATQILLSAGLSETDARAVLTRVADTYYQKGWSLALSRAQDKLRELDRSNTERMDFLHADRREAVVALSQEKL